MPIDFKALPKEQTFKIPPEGIHKVRIKTAKFTPAESGHKKDCILLTLQVFDDAGRSEGSMFDRVYDSSTDALGYKLGRLIHALGINLTSVVELKDFAKIIPLNKDFYADIARGEYNGKPKADVALFRSDIFWAANEFDIVQEKRKKFGYSTGDTNANGSAAVAEATDTPFFDSRDRYPEKSEDSSVSANATPAESNQY